MERDITGGPQWYGTLWVQLGDSVLVGVSELQCFHDVCWGPPFESAISWSVDDTSVVSTRVVSPDTLSPDSSIVHFTFSRARPLVLRGRKLGRTMVRAELEASASDTLPSLTPPSRSLTREVYVIPRVARIELTASAPTIHAGEKVELRVRVLDRLGRRVSVPVDLEYVGYGTVLGESRERVPYTFPAGRGIVIARFGPWPTPWCSTFSRRGNRADNSGSSTSLLAGQRVRLLRTCRTTTDIAGRRCPARPL